MLADTEVKWSGTFIRKSLAPVIFVPLSKMTADQWRVLDFENLRPEAQNRIAEAAATHNLIGFLHVGFIKGSIREGYFWPATEELLTDVESGDNSWFRNAEGSAVVTKVTQNLKNGVAVIGGMGLVMRTVLYTSLIKALTDDEEFEKAQMVQEIARDEATDALELAAQDIALRAALATAWEHDLEDIDELRADLDELPESDSADEADDLLREAERRMIEARARAGG